MNDLSILEITEMDVDLSKSIPCQAHPEVPATHRCSHQKPGCTFFVCTPCAEAIINLIKRLKYLGFMESFLGKNFYTCVICSNHFDPATIKCLPLKVNDD